MRLPFTLAVLLLAASAMPAPAQDQEMSDEELLELFQKQRDAFQAAQGNDLGAARGLELITVDDLTTTPDLAEPEAAPVPDSARPSVQDEVAGLPGPADTAEAGASGVAADQGVSVTSAEALGEPPAPDDVSASVVAATEPDSQGPSPVVFGRLAPDLQVNVRVTFAFDSATLSEDQLPKLEQLCHVMKESGINLFRIVGHTDALGSDAYNERLSLLRAQEVRRYFINTCGLGPDRLEAVGMGERFLFEPDNPAAAGNRRVEFQALS